MIVLKNEAEIERIGRSSQIAAKVLSLLKEWVVPGQKTKKLNEVAENIIRRAGGRPAFKGYKGFPASICVSVNEEVIHGVPGERRLKKGDIVSVDVGVLCNGFFGDAAATFLLDGEEKKKRRLVEVAEQALYRAIKQVVSGNRVGDISFAIQSYVERAGFSVVRDFVGHGIGHALHEDPLIPNFGSPGSGEKLRPGMVLAIETMVNMGKSAVRVSANRWTVVTCDRKPSAHFEHTVVLTENGVRILTLI
jgi:methionyl aminopeptidase